MMTLEFNHKEFLLHVYLSSDLDSFDDAAGTLCYGEGLKRHWSVTGSVEYWLRSSSDRKQITCKDCKRIIDVAWRIRTKNAVAKRLIKVGNA